MNRFRIIVASILLALVWAVNPVHTGAQDKTSKQYTVLVGHVVTLGWTASTSVVASYNVYVGGLTGGPYTKIGNVLSTAPLQFADKNATAGNTYYYVVTSVDSTGTESVNSNEALVMIPTP